MQQLQLAQHQQERQVSRHSLFMLVLFSNCVCTTCLKRLGSTWYLHVVLPMLPIPQHGVFKDLPSFVTICTPQGLEVKVTCMRHGWMPGLKNFLSVHRPRATLLALDVCAPPGGSTRKPWHYCLASALLFPCCLC
jgi:hypothetical protein